MPTTTARITFNPTEFTGAGAVTASTTLRKAGSATGIDQFTGISRVYKNTATNDISIAAAGDYADAQAGKIYIKNTTDTNLSSYLLVEVGSDVIVGRLYPNDWTFFPYDGTEDIKVSTSADNMYYEFAIFHEG
tara:strand:- start:245 stop:643 length:399 start_codon:yes stop_codon:yes gene_type:complete